MVKMTVIMTDQKTTSKHIEDTASDAQYMAIRIEQLEKQLETQSSTVQVSVADMNQMYSNHLNTIDTTLGIVAFFILIFGGVLGWLGYRNILDMIDNKVHHIVGTTVTAATEASLIEMQKVIDPIIAEQKKQEIQIQIETHYRLAAQAAKNEDHKKVIEHSNDVIALDPKHAESYYNRACAKYHLKQYGESIEDFNKSIEHEPSHPYSYSGRAVSKHESKQYEEAIEDYDKAISLAPNYDNAYYNKACTYCLLDKDPEETLELLKKSIELKNKNAKLAQEDDDFERLRENSEFRQLVGLE